MHQNNSIKTFWNAGHGIRCLKSCIRAGGHGKEQANDDRQHHSDPDIPELGLTDSGRRLYDDGSRYAGWRLGFGVMSDCVNEWGFFQTMYCIDKLIINQILPLISI